MATPQSAYGLKQGTFAVNQNGTAQYNFQFDLPPGINGLTPKLGLAYSHNKGDGPFGVGYSLEGISQISRVGANMAIDGFIGSVNFDTNDRFSLDGKRLINISSAYGATDAVYYTEINEWCNVQPTNPGFVVLKKDGTTYEYGTNPGSNSSFCSDGNTNNVRIWALNTVTDVHGNTINFTYTQNPTEGTGGSNLSTNENFYLSQISYSGYTVNLEYELRTSIGAPIIQKYVCGQEIITSYVLSNVTVSIAEEVISDYSFAYQQGSTTGKAQLINIVRSDGSGDNTLPPVSFAWQEAAPALEVCTKIENPNETEQFFAIDLNGDGITDALQFYDDGNGALKASSFIASYNSGSDTLIYSAAIESEINFPGYKSRQYEILLTNITCPTTSDVIFAFSENQNLSFLPFWSNGDGTFKPASIISTNIPYTNIDLCSIDVDGDGISDVVQVCWDDQNNLHFNIYKGLDIKAASQGQTLSPINITTNFSQTRINNNNCRLLPFDVNGDGIIDIVLAYEDKSGQLAFASFITSYQPPQITPAYFGSTIYCVPGPTVNYPGNNYIIPCDANGDGAIDIVVLGTGDNTGQISVTTFLSDFTGNFITVETPQISQTIGALNQINFYPMGFNGGTQTCILCGVNDPTGGTNNWSFYVLGSHSDGTFTYLTYIDGPQNIQNAAAFYIGDPKGTGKAGFFMTYQDVNISTKILSSYIVPYCSSGLYPDLINSITDMLGNTTSISYLPISDTSVYSESAANNLQYPLSSGLRYPGYISPSQYPIVSLLGSAIYVVESYTNTIIGFNSEIKYTLAYTDAQIDFSGRGWLGFATMATLNMNTGLRRIHTYNQDFPYNGTIFKTQIEGDGSISGDKNLGGNTNVILSLHVTTYTNIPTTLNTNTIYQVQASGSLIYLYDYGVWVYNLAQTYGYDSYGNRNLQAWLGYVDEIDPDTISPYSFPANINPQNPDEVVYTLSEYYNNETTWKFGYPLFSKTSTVNSPDTISEFQEGDLLLTMLTYDSEYNNLVTKSHWDNINNASLSTTYQYDTFGNKLSETFPAGNTISYTFEGTFNTYISEVTHHSADGTLSQSIYYGYDPRFGIRVAEMNENGFISVLATDSFGRTITKQGPVPVGCSQSDGNKVTSLVTGSNSNQFQSAIVITIETISYNQGTNYLSIAHTQLQSFSADIGTSSLTTTKYVDGLGRETMLLLESGQTSGDCCTVTTYDSCGQPASKSLPFFCPDTSNPMPPFSTNYVYDVLARPVSKTKPTDSGNTTTTTWVYENDSVCITQANGMPEAYTHKITNHIYHGKKRHVQSVIVSDTNATTLFTYDSIGRPLDSTDPIGISNSATYDSLSRKLSIDNPDQNTIGTTTKAFSFSYSPTSGKMESVTDASGAVTTYSYDGLGRLVSKLFADKSCELYSYDVSADNAIGKLATVQVLAVNQSVEFSKVFSYDAYGNVCGENVTINGAPTSGYQFTSNYDPAGRLVNQNLPVFGNLLREYQYGVLTSASLGDVTVNYPLNEYLANGEFQTIQCFSSSDMNLPAVTFDYTFNPSATLNQETITLASNSNPALDFTYTYDNLYQLLSVNETINNSSESFTYQNKKVASATIPGTLTPSETFSFDAGGNITSRNSNTYTFNAHFPSGISDGTTTVYAATQDACGRISTRTTNAPGQSQTASTFEYDPMGNLAELTVAGDTTLFSYDPRGNRVKEVKSDGTTVYYISPILMVEVSGHDASVTSTAFINDQKGTIASVKNNNSLNSVSFFRRNHKGNVTHVIDNTGTILNSTVYDTFGLPTAVSGSIANEQPTYEYKFWNEQSSLLYFGARYYDPAVGCFLTPDTQLGANNYLQHAVWNRFAFELNNPVNRVDPSGHFSWEAFGEGILADLVGIIATMVLSPVGGALAEAGVETAFSHGSAKSFGLNFAADIATDAINTVVSIPAILLAPETGGASMVAYGAIAGALTGAASGYLDSFTTQLITTGNVSLKAAGESALVSGIIGGVIGAVGAKTGALQEMKATSGKFFEGLGKSEMQGSGPKATLMIDDGLRSFKPCLPEGINIFEEGPLLRWPEGTNFPAGARYLVFKISWDITIAPYKDKN